MPAQRSRRYSGGAAVCGQGRWRMIRHLTNQRSNHYLITRYTKNQEVSARHASVRISLFIVRPSIRIETEVLRSACQPVPGMRRYGSENDLLHRFQSEGRRLVQPGVLFQDTVSQTGLLPRRRVLRGIIRRCNEAQRPARLYGPAGLLFCRTEQSLQDRLHAGIIDTFLPPRR